jgi:hypothetical protein
MKQAIRQKELRISTDRYHNGADVCYTLFRLDDNFIISQTDQQTAEQLKNLLSNESEDTFVKLREFHDTIQTSTEILTRFKRELDLVIPKADYHGLKGKCIVVQNKSR